MTLRVKRASLVQANAFVSIFHRHNKPVKGWLFGFFIMDDDLYKGCAIVSRPVARKIDDGLTAEITRMCSIGDKNVCSFGYGRARKISFLLGIERVITYTRNDENGASLIAAGFIKTDEVKAGQWSRKLRGRGDNELIDKQRWESINV